MMFGLPMRRDGGGFRDVETGRMVYRWVDTKGRKWLAHHRWDLIWRVPRMPELEIDDGLRAEVEALRELCGMAYQLAGVHNAPEKWLDALSNAAAGRPFSTDGLLPYWPQAVSEATQPGGSDNAY